MKLFHGSPVENFVPQYGLGNDEYDYGRGFYTTAVPELARRCFLCKTHCPYPMVIDFDNPHAFYILIR